MAPLRGSYYYFDFLSGDTMNELLAILIAGIVLCCVFLFLNPEQEEPDDSDEENTR